MDRPEIPQFPLHGSQVSEGGSSIAPRAPRHRICESSNTVSQSPQPDRRPEPQGMPSGSSERLPELSWRAHRPDPQYSELSAPPLQASSSIPPSTYASSRTQQDLASLESQTYDQYVVSGYSLPSSYFELWATESGDGSPSTPMDASAQAIVQGSFRDDYNPGAEKRNELLSELGSWGRPRVPGEANVLDHYSRSDGRRYSLDRCSVTDQREGFTLDPRLIENLLLMETNPARPNQGRHSQEIGWPVDPSARGIDQSLQPAYFSEVHSSFVEDANNTNTDAENSLNEGYHHDPGFYDNHRPGNRPALAPSFAPEPRIIPSSIPSNLTTPFDSNVHSQFVSESSRRCEPCDRNFSNPENLRRHIREKHGEQFQYICRLAENGSVCRVNVGLARNRRRHVERIHPRKSTELPPTSENRRSNPKTDEMLNEWFREIQQ